MNRIIKFRAWHTKAKKMFSAEEMGKDELTLSVDGRGFVNVNGASTKLSQYITDMTPMQFTGLKDKNGKEIFEGDILNDSEYAQRFEVIWRNGMFSLKILNDNNFHRWIRDNEKLEIIGNIYENPELIKNYPEK